MRKFEVVRKDCLKYDKEPPMLPIRSTKNSAGYDMFSPVDIVIKSGSCETLWTNVKATCNEDEYFMVCVRSSMGKKGIILANGVGIIDSDYYSNESNDGNIGLMLRNLSNEDFVITRGDKIGQAIFMKYLFTDDDVPSDNIRKSGFGSSGK